MLFRLVGFEVFAHENVGRLLSRCNLVKNSLFARVDVLQAHHRACDKFPHLTCLVFPIELLSICYF
jgi:hypothetical protein